MMLWAQLSYLQQQGGGLVVKVVDADEGCLEGVPVADFTVFSVLTNGTLRNIMSRTILLLACSFCFSPVATTATLAGAASP